MSKSFRSVEFFNITWDSVLEGTGEWLTQDQFIEFTKESIDQWGWGPKISPVEETLYRWLKDRRKEFKTKKDA
jgi:hypothetical protein